MTHVEKLILEFEENGKYEPQFAVAAKELKAAVAADKRSLAIEQWESCAGDEDAMSLWERKWT